jgi:hypothetical protein
MSGAEAVWRPNKRIARADLAHRAESQVRVSDMRIRFSADAGFRFAPNDVSFGSKNHQTCLGRLIQSRFVSGVAVGFGMRQSNRHHCAQSRKRVLLQL